MKKRFWKIEYSITIITIFGIILLILPFKIFPSNEAAYISHWNEMFNKIDYMFIAMSAQADSDIVKSLNKTPTHTRREEYMIQLVRPYLRLHEQSNLNKKYHPHYMNGAKVKNTDFYYFKNLYLTDDGDIVGIKDIKGNNQNQPGFVISMDMNGLKSPNKWGKDIFGVYIFSDGRVKSIGYDWDIDRLKKDCSENGTGVSCSHYYRIGGEFYEQ